MLDSMDLEPLYRSSSRPLIPGNDYLLDAFRRTFHSKFAYDATCWFHLTRVPDSCNFEAGILPLNQALDSIWEFLYSLVRGQISENQWNEFRQGKQFYNFKTENPFHWGPYAILVRDIAFKPEKLGNHDYF
jgi:hypothetical protein